ARRRRQTRPSYPHDWRAGAGPVRAFAARRRHRRLGHLVSRDWPEAKMFPPQRIVCLTEETVETLYLLGEQDRIVGISGYCVRPPEARRDKPRVPAFTSADLPKILGLHPDLVISFSDLQADIVAALIRQGIAVHAFNQRTITEIF